MNIVLTGMMGSGKTAVGRILAERTGMKFIDMDADIEKNAGMTISAIFEQKGEEEFRKIERKLVMLISLLDNCVISTGGGVVLDAENMKALRKNGKIVYLKASPEVLYKRVKDEGGRPLLEKRDPLIEMRRIYTKRKKLYADCDLKVETAGMKPEEVCGRIIKKVLKKKNG